MALTHSQRGPQLQEVRLAEQDVEVEVVPQEVSLSDLMTREGPAAYAGTEGFGGLVGVVGKAMDAAERTRGSAGARRRAQAHDAGNRWSVAASELSGGGRLVKTAIDVFFTTM